MDMEKYTSGKTYHFFEWAFKLVIWNLLTLLIIFIVAGAPLFSFYKVQDQYTVTDVEINNNNIITTLKNGSKKKAGIYCLNEEIKEFSINDNVMYFNMNKYSYKINNENRIRHLDSLKLENNILKGYFQEEEYLFGDIFSGEVDLENSRINNNDLLIAFNNGLIINYGQVFEVNNLLLSFLGFLFIILALLTFIPTYITLYSVIKVYSSDGSSGIFSLYLNKLAVNFKSVYKLLFIIIPILSLLIFSVYYYFNVIRNLETNNFFVSLSYNILLVTLLIVILFILNLPHTISYFRMDFNTIFRLTLNMTFKNILHSFGYLIFLILPILLSLINNFFIPIWFLVGLSLPQFLSYFISIKKYRNLEKNIKNLNESEIEK